jgi:hypothetical protein
MRSWVAKRVLLFSSSELQEIGLGFSAELDQLAVVETFDLCELNCLGLVWAS